MKKIPAKYTRFVIAFFMALFMSGLMSFVSIVMSHSGESIFSLLPIWIEVWPRSFMIALPVVIIVSPMVQKVARFFIEESK